MIHSYNCPSYCPKTMEENVHGKELIQCVNIKQPLVCVVQCSVMIDITKELVQAQVSWSFISRLLRAPGFEQQCICFRLLSEGQGKTGLQISAKRRISAVDITDTSLTICGTMMGIKSFTLKHPAGRSPVQEAETVPSSNYSTGVLDGLPQ